MTMRISTSKRKTLMTRKLSEDLVQEIALADEIQRMERAQQQRNADRVPIPQITSETGSDPVRLYLKEIGQVDLLDVDHEFWLATQSGSPQILRTDLQAEPDRPAQDTRRRQKPTAPCTAI